MDNKQPEIQPVASVLAYLASYAVSFSRVYFYYDLLKKEPWLLVLRTILPPAGSGSAFILRIQLQEANFESVQTDPEH